MKYRNLFYEPSSKTLGAVHSTIGNFNIQDSLDFVTNMPKNRIPIAIVNVVKKQMIWHNLSLGEQHCQEKVDQHFNNLNQ